MVEYNENIVLNRLTKTLYQCHDDNKEIPAITPHKYQQSQTSSYTPFSPPPPTTTVNANVCWPRVYRIYKFPRKRATIQLHIGGVEFNARGLSI